MTLKEAIESGRPFNRATEADTGIYYTSAEEFLGSGISLEDFNATDYELEPEVNVSIKESILTDAWNRSRPAGGRVAVASESEFYKRFASVLSESGVTIIK